jgi:gamma-glutamylcyclotransferase (GGCT)/AIG2-like uncharacterized protein YtfP
MNIFVYGTLMDREIMNQASGSDFHGEKAVLRGFGRYLLKNALYPGMLREKGSQVDGLLYLNVSQEAVHRLDIFEGDMYARTEVTVYLDNGGTVQNAMAYVIKDEYSHTLSSTKWDFEKFLCSGKKLFTRGYQGFEDLGQTMNLSADRREDER